MSLVLALSETSLVYSFRTARDIWGNISKNKKQLEKAEASTCTSSVFLMASAGHAH